MSLIQLYFMRATYKIRKEMIQLQREALGLGHGPLETGEQKMARLREKIARAKAEGVGIERKLARVMGVPAEV
ncbi:hypothetical protein LTR10_006734 [Elasticomyces elasticus]|nr:hypothetical protein LTR10_006734 [Elasticomyces elasticus]KAK4972866.1 hypothetical protein LTR42_006160 [Elasticomyces elasticus]